MHALRVVAGELKVAKPELLVPLKVPVDQVPPLPQPEPLELVRKEMLRNKRPDAVTHLLIVKQKVTTVLYTIELHIREHPVKLEVAKAQELFKA